MAAAAGSAAGAPIAGMIAATSLPAAPDPARMAGDTGLDHDLKERERE